MKHTALRSLFSLLFLLIFLLPASVKADPAGHSAPKTIAQANYARYFMTE